MKINIKKELKTVGTLEECLHLINFFSKNIKEIELKEKEKITAYDYDRKYSYYKMTLILNDEVNDDFLNNYGDTDA